MKKGGSLIDFFICVRTAIHNWLLVLNAVLALLFCVVEYEIMGVVDLSGKGLRLVSPLLAINVVCGAVYFLGQMRDNNVIFLGVGGYVTGLGLAVSVYCLIHNALFPITTKGIFAAFFCYIGLGLLVDVTVGVIYAISKRTG